MKKFTVFANFFIDSEERFLRLKDSFFSFEKANINEWIINVRGDYKGHVKNFLENRLKEKLKIFFLETDKGWVNDTLEITKYINSKIIFFWIEDHICIKSIDKINSVVKEMYDNDVDHLIYTFYRDRIFLEPLQSVEHKVRNNISLFQYNLQSHDQIKKWCEQNRKSPNYLISSASFLSLKLFKKNLQISNNKKKYNKMLPFNFERNFFEIEILPFVNGVLNDELFVSIDDDHGLKGSSLISRKLYPNRVTKKELDGLRKEKISIFNSNIFKKIIVKIYKIFK